MNNKQTSDHKQNGGRSGTKTTSLSPRETTSGKMQGTTPGVSGAGVAGADTANRNKRSGS